MKKTVLIHNTLLSLSYIVSVCVLEILCLAKLIMDPGWKWEYDFLIILISFIILVGHYLWIHRMGICKLISKATLLILMMFDIAITTLITGLLIIPNDIIGKPVVRTHFFIIVVQAAILLARLCFCISKKRTE